MLKRLLKKYAVNSSRVHLERLNQEFAHQVKPEHLVLDAGAGMAPYKHMFSHAKYESADFELVDKPYARSTYVCDLAKIPVEDGRFDFILFNQVLEHIPEPTIVLMELNRVLKPGGKMLCTAPFFYEEHEKPYDFFRYTQFAYRHLMTKAGFNIDEIGWNEGYLGTVAYQLDAAVRYLPTVIPGLRPRFLGWVFAVPMVVLKFIFSLAAVAFYRLDIAAPYRSGGYPKNYVVLVSKPV